MICSALMSEVGADYKRFVIHFKINKIAELPVKHVSRRPLRCLKRSGGSDDSLRTHRRT